MQCSITIRSTWRQNLRQALTNGRKLDAINIRG